MDDPVTAAAIGAVEAKRVKAYWSKDRYIGALFFEMNGMSASFSHQQIIETPAQKYWLECGA